MNPPSSDAPTSPGSVPAKRPRWVWAAALAILAGAAAVLVYARYAGARESTDDAFLDGEIVAVAPSVAGRVASVRADGNQAGKRGEPRV